MTRKHLEPPVVLPEGVLEPGNAPTISADRLAAERIPPRPAVFRGRRYDDEGLLGRGGMGEVRLLRDEWIGRAVAVKRLPPELAASAEGRSRFLREAGVQAQLEHPSVVPVYDIGVDDQEQYYFTMKRIGGRTLDDLLKPQKDQRPSRIAYSRNKLLSIFAQVCRAIEYAHSRGVIHRDLKPANIMIGDFGEVYVLDWGLAKVNESSSVTIEDSARTYTVAGQVFGTPGYMAPEQVAGAEQTTERSDVYSLGAILFQIITGKAMHSGKTAQELLRSTQRGDNNSPAKRAPKLDIPPELDALCLRATEVDDDKRLASVRELADAIEHFLDGDRDVTARRQLAARYATRADKSASLSLQGVTPEKNRAEALRLAGRALALDPHSPAALQTTARLMLAPPQETPSEITREMTDAREQGEWRRLRVSAVIHVVLLCVLLLPMTLYVRSLGGIILTTGLIGSTALFMAWTSWRQYRGSRLLWAQMLSSAGVAAGIGALSCLGGANVIVPGFIVALAVQSFINTGTARRWLVTAMALLGFLVPAIGEWVGWLPASYVVEDGVVKILPNAIHFHDLPIRLGSIAATVAAVIGAVIIIKAVIDSADELRQREALQRWHLKKLVGDSALQTRA